MPLVRVPVDHVAVPLGHRLADASVVAAQDLDHEPLLVVDRADAPQTHDVITGYLAGLGVHPAWVTHGATQIERVFDMVAREAARYGVTILESEVIGLIPSAALIGVAEHYLQLERFSSAQILENKLRGE